jgi:hypothetical protein
MKITPMSLRHSLDPAAMFEDVVGPPDAWQRRLLRSTSKRRLLVAGRQCGKSQVCAVAALHNALFSPDSLILCLAPSLRQSQELFGQIITAYRALENVPVPPQAERKLSLELDNGSRIVTLPGSEKTIRGFSNVAMLLVDEAARVDDALYYAVRPMLAVSGGTLIMLSTPFGRRGIFFETYTQAQDHGDWEIFHAPATECPRISLEFLEEERQSMGDWWFSQEYEAKFMGTPGAWFTDEIMVDFMDDDIEPLTLDK